MCPFETRERGAREVRRRIRADWLRRKDFVEFELGTKCSDEIPDTASANIDDSPSVPNSRGRGGEQCRAGAFRKGPHDRNINVSASVRARCDVAQTAETIVRRSASVTTSRGRGVTRPNATQMLFENRHLTKIDEIRRRMGPSRE